MRMIIKKVWSKSNDEFYKRKYKYADAYDVFYLDDETIVKLDRGGGKKITGCLYVHSIKEERSGFIKTS